MVITDGAWHRIGFVWDGFNRSLYVDDILVAEDTQQGLGSSVGGCVRIISGELSRQIVYIPVFVPQMTGIEAS